MEAINAPDGGAAVVPAPTVTPAPNTAPMDVSEAARHLSQWRKQKETKAEPDAPIEAAAEPPQDLAETPDSDPPQEAPAETTEQPEPELPPIEPPRSWTKDEKERFQSLPRETQEYIAQREQEREREIRRSQNEAAENRKVIEAERQRVEQVRQEYEAKLPAVKQALLDAQAGAFPDIRTIDDVTRLAQEDPFRYLQWQAHQQKLQAVSYEIQKAEERKSQEQQSQWAEHVQKENQLFSERAPEFADRAKAAELTQKAISKLTDIGFTDQELGELANGKSKLSIFDHRVQLLILDSVRYHEARANIAKPQPKAVPPVQRPGTAPSKGAQVQAQVQAAAERLSKSRGQDAISAAVDLMRARRTAKR